MSRPAAGAESLPEWLQPVAELGRSIRAEDLAPTYPHPPADARPAAVLMLFADGPNGRELLLTERATTLRHHAGQISFPGGGADPEDGEGVPGAIVTALREAHEEVGLDPGTVEPFAVLPPLWLPPSNFAVRPVMGWWAEHQPLAPVSLDEVDAVLHVPLATLLDPERRFTVVGPQGWRGPAFDIGASVPLWGFTAGIVSRVFETAGWEIPWDTSREQPWPGAS